MNKTLEKYFNVNDTLEPMKGGGEQLDVSKNVAVDVSLVNGSVRSVSVGNGSSDSVSVSNEIGSVGGGSNEIGSSVNVNGISESSDSETESEGSVISVNEIGSDSESDSGIEIDISQLVKDSKKNSRIRTYFKFFELYNLDRLLKLSDKVKNHYGIDIEELDNPRDDNLRIKLTNSFMDVIYFCFLSKKADQKFWSILFNKSELSNILGQKFNDATELDIIENIENIKYVFENGNLHELLFDTKSENDRSIISYELILEFIYRIKQELKQELRFGNGNISLKGFFEHLKVSTAYRDILIKKQLKSLKLRVTDTNTGNAPEYSLTLEQFKSKTLPQNISSSDSVKGKTISIIINEGVLTYYNEIKETSNVFDSIESVILNKINLNSVILKKLNLNND